MELFWLRWPSAGGGCSHVKLKDPEAISGVPGVIESCCSSRSADMLGHAVAAAVLLPLQKGLLFH